MQNLKEVKIEPQGANDDDPIETDFPPSTKNRSTFSVEAAEQGSVDDERDHDHVSASRTNSVEEEEERQGSGL